MLGRPVARQLHRAGYDVRVIARDPAKAKGFEGMEVVRGDIFDAASLREAFRGCDGLYLNLSPGPSEGPSDRHAETDGLRIALDEARKAGIRRVGFISSLVKDYQGIDGFHWWVFDVKQEAVRILKESGLPYLIFYPSSFMENFDATQRKGDKVLLAGTSRAPMWFIAGDDYGRMVAKAFALPEGESGEFPVQGREPFTYDEAAAVFVKHHPGKLRISKTPSFVIRLAGLVSPMMNRVWHIVHALNHYPERFQSEETWKRLGEPEITLAEYARRGDGKT